MKTKKIFIFVILSSVFSLGLSGQDGKQEIEELKKQAPKVFIDCQYCDIDYIRTEIVFVNYVWDRKEADVHVLITFQWTGSGGREYTLAFIGLEEYSKLQNTLKFVSGQTDTDDEIRKGLVDVLKKGFMPYVARTPISPKVEIVFKEEVEATSVEDKWNFWVFNLSFNSFLRGQKTLRSGNYFGDVSASRVTPESKLRIGLYGNWDKSEFDLDEETITSSRESRGFDCLYVKSLGEHMSAGIWFSAESSTYNNVELGISPSPAVEFNVFPYSESTRRQLRILYRLHYDIRRYCEETIYDKTDENLWKQSLRATLELKEPWGTVEAYVQGSHYFYDFNKYRLGISGELSLRLVKGLSLNVWGRYSRINDQLSLVKGELTLEEILLRRKELATGYSYFVMIGLSYSFGSIFSNVVNPRFGNSGYF